VLTALAGRRARLIALDESCLVHGPSSVTPPYNETHIMNPIVSSLIHTTHAVLFGSLLSFTLAACGSSAEPMGESEQPISAGDSDAQEDSANSACAEGIAPEEATPAQCQVTARALCFASAEAACACQGCGRDECVLAESFPAQAVCPGGGNDPDPDGTDSDSSDPNTPVSSGPIGGGSNGSSGTGVEPGNLGCGAPGQTEPSEPSPPAACADGVAPDTGSERPCDFVVAGSCFDDADSACACAGCAPGQCLILESYPAQITCAS
jgi:hypothetical protein